MDKLNNTAKIYYKKKWKHILYNEQIQLSINHWLKSSYINMVQDNIFLVMILK